ncbi:hypothetical protein FIBSPDRAFT_837989 [Athelia psychrophila]|uniref:Uncharacterized protein n=1 Tax=Athelia psychrophila TaxID=1759441 RepID=A0A165ZTN6_9AGAM|nr:hypothetical protein FIBSPDRAFT_837989 [Fibularhizoctonia sp. CBS 109695]
MAPNTCNELDKCRSLVSIVTSCLATIFACIWVAVHPNMPGPEQSWMSRQIESFKLVVATLLVPEWVLAWAVRQYLQARHYGKILEEARVEAANDAALPRGRNSTNKGNTPNPSSSDEGSEQPAPSRLQELSTPRANLSTECAGSMGFYCYKNGKPRFPLQVDDVSDFDYCGGREDKSHYILTLVKSRSLVPPTLDELGDKSKGDALSKSIAILQTLWFVAQCIARRIGNLAITNLEIMTLAYTVITVAMNAAWWHKPLNVRCPIRIEGDAKIVKNPKTFKWTSRNIIYYVIGEQDCIFCLRGKERVPTFWSSCSTMETKLPLYADIIALTVAMVFGAVHCAAWSYVFSSLAEQWMWRVCAIAIAAIPLPMAAAFAVSDPFAENPPHIAMVFMALGALLYILARMILLVLSFTTLRHLPPSAFQTVQWTTWIPHL